jgi:GT2 family glycosyltransferase
LREFGPDGDAFVLETIVVDSASTDDTAAMVATAFPWVRLLVSNVNLGFSAGSNRGYAASRGHFVYFLNPDTELVCDGQRGNSLWHLLSAIRAENSVGVVGPQLRYGDGRLQRSCRRYPKRLTGFFESTWLGRALPWNPWCQHLHMADWQVDFRHDVDWLVGAAMLARREALEAVRMPDYQGPFDEGFFMYSEELDLCRRVQDAGWRIVYIPDAAVIHHEGQSSEQVVAARHIHFNTSKVRYQRKAYGNGWAEGLRRYLLWEFRVQLALEWLKGALGHRRDLRRARVEAYRQVIRSGLRE